MGFTKTLIKDIINPLRRGGDGYRASYAARVNNMDTVTRSDYARYMAAKANKQPIPGLNLAERDIKRFQLMDRRLAAAKRMDSARQTARWSAGGSAVGLAGGIAHGLYNRNKEQSMAGVQKVAAAPAQAIPGGKLKDLLLGGMEVAEPMVAGAVGSMLGAGGGLVASHLTSPVGMSKDVIRKEELAREYQTGINRVRERMALNAFRAQLGAR